MCVGSFVLVRVCMCVGACGLMLASVCVCVWVGGGGGGCVHALVCERMCGCFFVCA